MQKSGILDGLKGQMRSKLYDHLKLRNEKADLNIRDQSNRLVFKIAVSLMADFMQKCDMPYGLSVLLPESGINKEILSKGELLEVMRLNNDESIASKPEMTPLLMDIIEQLKAAGSLRPNMVSSYVQTEEAGEEAMNLDQRLRKIDYQYMERTEIERIMPFKSLEERMLKFKRECETKYKEELESEVRRLKEFEMSKLRMEEAQKYRLKLQEYRDEMESLHIDKLKELKAKEQEAWDRIKHKERDIDKLGFEQRQKVLRDEELLRYKEADIKKTIEMDQVMLKQERERFVKSEREYELKLKEMDTYKIKLEKDHLEDVERFKSEFQRKFKDQDFDMHRRKLQLQEDEQKMQYEKEKLALLDSKNKKMEKELNEFGEELRKLKTDYNKSVQQNQDFTQQIKTLNENLRRETEILLSRDKENCTLVHENSTLKEILQDLRNHGNTYKEDQNQLIENLRLQLNETREMINKMRENKDKEVRKLKERYDDERRREVEQYQTDYDKMRGDLSLMQKKLGQEEHYNKEMSVLNNKLQNNMARVRGTSQTREFEQHDVREFTTNTKTDHHHFYHGHHLEEGESEDEDLVQRRKAWAELDREQQEIKRNIKSMMKTAPESRVIDNPMLADRVRNVRYEPQKYNNEDEAEELKIPKVKQRSKEEEKQKSQKSPEKQKQENNQQQPNNNQQQQYPSQKRQWTAPSPSKQEEEKKSQTPISHNQDKQQPSPQSKQEKQEEIRFSSYTGANTQLPPPQKDQGRSTLQNQPVTLVSQPEVKPINYGTPSTSIASGQKKNTAFKGPSFNPLKKTTTISSEVQQPLSQIGAKTSGTQANFMRQSSDKSQDIVDEYDEA